MMTNIEGGILFMYGTRFKPMPYADYQSMHYQANPFIQSHLVRQNSLPPNYGMNEVPYQQWGGYPYPVNPSLFQQQMQGNYSNQSGYYSPPGYQQPPNKSVSQSLFQNPLNMQEDSNQYNPNMMQNNYPYMHPYPKASFLMKQPQGMKSMLNSFKSQDGTFDMNKMVDTAGVMMNAVSQVSNVVKGLSGMIKV